MAGILGVQGDKGEWDSPLHILGPVAPQSKVQSDQEGRDGDRVKRVGSSPLPY